MIPLKIVMIGAQELHGRFKRSDAATREQMRLNMTRVLMALDAHIINTKLTGQVLFKQRGILAKMSRKVEETSRYSVRGILSTTSAAFYGETHETGMPARINAVHGPFMTFFWKRMNRWVRIPSVKVVKRPFMAPSLVEKRPEIVRALGEAYSMLVKGR